MTTSGVSEGHVIVDLDRARRVRAMFQEQPEPVGVSLAHGFAGLTTLLQIAVSQGRATRETHEAVNNLRDDVMSLLTLMARLQWQLELRVQGEMNEGIWVYFTRLDIEYFFVVLRSAFDHVGGALKSVALKPGQAPQDFHELRKLAKGKRGPEILGEEICAFVSDSEWFVDVRDWRDEITHRGGWALSFIDGETIPFQVYKGSLSRVLVPGLMYNENAADFRRLSALLLANFILYLEDLDQLIRKRADLPRLGPTAFTVGPGTLVFREWLTNLIDSVPPLSFPQPPGKHGGGPLSSRCL